MSPEVTAIVTTHQRPEHVRNALRSLAQETHRDFECLVVDDGESIDPDRLREWHPGARLIRGHSLGVAAARNLGLGAASGTFSIFLDDDDLALPSRISTLLRTAKTQHADLCYGMTRRVAADGADAGNVPTHRITQGLAGLCDLLTCAPHINAVLVRTELLRRAGGFDGRSAHFDDWSAWLRLADRDARIWSVDDVLAEWHLHDAGLTGLVSRTRVMNRYLLELFDRLRGELSAEGALAVEVARRVASGQAIESYDDYADAMSVVRATMHSRHECLGPRLLPHCD